jgi:uncharacterized membrane protein YccC
VDDRRQYDRGRWEGLEKRLDNMAGNLRSIDKRLAEIEAARARMEAIEAAFEKQSVARWQFWTEVRNATFWLSAILAMGLSIAAWLGYGN